MIPELDDKILTARIAGGDTEAENYLFSLYKERIKFLVRVRLKRKVTENDQEDIISEIQQAILISLRKGSFQPDKGKPLEAYIAGIAGNIVGQYFRKLNKTRIATNIHLVERIPSTENNLSNLITEERNNKLKKYLQKLKPKYKEVLLLRIYEDKSIEEISKRLNIEKRRVSERINYAFKLLLKECKKDNYFQYFHE